MISKELINQYVEEWINNKPFFLVDLNISSDLRISIEIESVQGNVSIDDCAELSKQIESRLSSLDLDFALEVSSAGIGQAFKVFRQYQKHLNQEVDVRLKNGQKLAGILLSCDEEKFCVSVMRKIKPEGAKRPKLIEQQESYTHEETASVCSKILF
ncbi:MAG: ribosome assembly cofactor RimP [Bacteroidales bacterium]|nr:ribosome assembly cofactor RimP [Bacteroidales bacterium]MDD3430831.1 ribosome assembly cofactor RimP [Bacteroidales bacterium]MDD4361243.1 ribosome assembly cofactor RimP [Bacteroidales bacterium]MDD4431900.1 ribosome assembly cofactor RimP [Bacteroidales bacterium]